MKETIKASIGGYAFTLDKDAYNTLKIYLDNIRTHFENKEDGEEIISDIEYRMCELLQMKVSKTDNIVTLEDAESIIKIMGNPIDFADDDSIEKPSTNNKQTFKKKLYRDTDHSILGGVCSGLAQYFHLDPVIIRIGFIASVILGKVITGKISSLIVLAYIILWVVTPAAKTMIQKLAMSGENPTIEGIETGTSKIKKPKGSGLGQFLLRFGKVFASIPLIITGLSIIIITFIAFFFTYVFNLPSVGELSEIFGLNPINITAALFFIWIIPAIIIFYIGIKLITKITRKDVTIIGISFLIWIGAIAYASRIAFEYGREYKNKASIAENIKLDSKIDTLHIAIGANYNTAEPFFPGTNLYRVDIKPESWFLLPKIEIKKDSIYKDIEIEIEKTAFSRRLADAEEKVSKSIMPYSTNDSVFTITPLVYSKNNIWNKEFFTLTIYCPIDKEVIIEEPIQKWIEMDKYPERRRNSTYVFTFDFDD